MSEELTECDNCMFECNQSELKSNFDGFCDACQRWSDCLHSEEKPCELHDDSSNYLCRECRNGKNFKLDLRGTKKWKLNRIAELEEEIKILKKEMN